MKTNNQNAVLTVETLKGAAQTLRDLRNRLPFPPALTPAERHQFRAQRIGPRTLQLLQERLAAAHKNRELLPPAFDLRKFTKDAATVGALSDCLAEVKTLEEAFRDTLLTAASQAKEEGDLVYGHILVSTGGGRLKRSVSKIAPRGIRTARAPGPGPIATTEPAAVQSPSGPPPPPVEGPAPSGPPEPAKAA